MLSLKNMLVCGYDPNYQQWLGMNIRSDVNIMFEAKSRNKERKKYLFANIGKNRAKGIL